jgi:hypothetical protein
MYSHENGSSRGHGRLLITLEHQLKDQIRLPWLLRGLRDELEMEKEASGTVEHDLGSLGCAWGDSGAPNEGHRSPWC